MGSYYEKVVLIPVCFHVGHRRTGPLALGGNPHFPGPRRLDRRGFYSKAWGVSADGSVVVGISESTSGYEAFRWTADSGMVGFGDLPGWNFWSEAHGVSADGSVVVGWSPSASGNEAFIWDNINGMRNLKDVLVGAGLDLTGWRLDYATGVSDDGRTIVGHGTKPSGGTEAWIARLDPLPSQSVPEPGTLLLLGSGLAGLFGFRRKGFFDQA